MVILLDMAQAHLQQKQGRLLETVLHLQPLVCSRILGQNAVLAHFREDFRMGRGILQLGSTYHLRPFQLLPGRLRSVQQTDTRSA